MIHTLYFWARWSLANALLNASERFAQFACKVAPPRRQA
jgi:hypothetical protein